jgi:hypothetical protein
MDPAELAARIRELAKNANRILRRPSPTCDEINHLLTEISAIRNETRQCFEALDQWLQSVESQVELRRRSRLLPLSPVAG